MGNIESAGYRNISWRRDRKGGLDGRRREALRQQKRESQDLTVKLCFGILWTFFVCLFLIASGWGCLLNLQPVNSVPQQENSAGTEPCLCSTDTLRKSGVGILEKPSVLSHCLKISWTKPSCQNSREVPKKMSERPRADTFAGVAFSSHHRPHSALNQSPRSLLWLRPPATPHPISLPNTLNFTIQMSRESL